MFAFQPGALQGIIHGQSDAWFTGGSGITIEEINDDEWVTETEGANSASSGTHVLVLTDAEPEVRSGGIRNSRLFFPIWKVEDMRTNKDGESFLVRTRMATAPGSALLVDPGSPENLCGDQ